MYIKCHFRSSPKKLLDLVASQIITIRCRLYACSKWLPSNAELLNKLTVLRISVFINFSTREVLITNAFPMNNHWLLSRTNLSIFHTLMPKIVHWENQWEKVSVTVICAKSTKNREARIKRDNESNITPDTVVPPGLIAKIVTRPWPDGMGEVFTAPEAKFTVHLSPF